MYYFLEEVFLQLVGYRNPSLIIGNTYKINTNLFDRRNSKADLCVIDLFIPSLIKKNGGPDPKNLFLKKKKTNKLWNEKNMCEYNYFLYHILPGLLGLSSTMSVCYCVPDGLR